MERAGTIEIEPGTELVVKVRGIDASVTVSVAEGTLNVEAHVGGARRTVNIKLDNDGWRLAKKAH
jgi:hypothetical protein